MGNPLSKTFGSSDDSAENTSVPTTPILKSKFNNIHIDPRSPSANITRTPITALNNIDLNKSITIECISTPSTKKVNNYAICADPRSPTTEYVRTPIVSSTLKDVSKVENMKLHNKNLDNVRKTIIHSASFNQKGDGKESVVTPRLLGSSPVKQKVVDDRRKSFAGLLETNIDYVETDLDKVIAKNTPMKSTPDLSTPINKLREQFLNSSNPNTIPVSCLENADPRSPTIDFIRTPIQITKKIGEIELNTEDEECISDSDCEVQSNDVTEETNVETNTEVTLEVVNEVKVVVTEESKVVTITETKVEVCEQQIEIKKTDNLDAVINSIESNQPLVAIKELMETIDLFDKEKEMPKANMIKNVKEFDKKLSNLIYEDAEPKNSPQLRKIKDGNRTPLGLRSENSVKTNSKLKVSDKPTKNANSKIPVFKEKLIKGKLEPCENTPPRNKHLNKSKWDTDCSLII